MNYPTPLENKDYGTRFKHSNYVLLISDAHKLEDGESLKVKGQEEIRNSYANKKAGLTRLISAKGKKH